MSTHRDTDCTLGEPGSLPCPRHLEASACQEGACPLTGIHPVMDLCHGGPLQPASCIYFRGASSTGGRPVKAYTVICNWPRNGSAIAPERPGWDVPIPDLFRQAFPEEDAA